MATLQEIVNNVWNSVTGFLKVGGTAAHDAAATGNPVQMGGVYRVADPALADGDVGSLRLNVRGEALMQLTGRTLVETTAHNAVALVDTNIVYSAAIDVSSYKQVTLKIFTSLNNATNNANPTVSLHTATPTSIINGAGTLATKTLPYGTYGVSVGHVILTTSDIAALGGLPSSIKIGIKAAVAPTSGSITVVVQGVPN